MSSQTSVIDIAGGYEEVILQLAKHLGRDKNRRAVFNLIYGRGSKPRSKKQIADQLGKSGSAQVIQNALDELAKHHLIVRKENTGQVKDGSRWVYQKDSSVRANRVKIVKFADNPSAASRVATKRRPSMLEPSGNFIKSTGNKIHRGARARTRLKIAVFMTNPDRAASLQTGIEARYIQNGIKLGSSRPEEIDVKLVPAPILDTWLDFLNSYRPDIVHFSGHGGDRTLLFDNERAGDDGGTALDFDKIARVLSVISVAPKLLVLVACDTVAGADRFLERVPAVIAMADVVGDEASCEFSKRFYQSLSAGATINDSLEQAKIALEHKGFKDADLPTLVVRNQREAKRALV